jgi:hypothetical protein
MKEDTVEHRFTYQRQEAFEQMIDVLVAKVEPLDAPELRSVYVDRGMRIMLLKRDKIAEETYDAETKKYEWRILI